MQSKKIVVLTGAGISAESGLSTFRDSGGLWDGHDILEVASIDGWYKNPEKVLDFYNTRRKQLVNVKPNKAHLFLAKLEDNHDVTIITQNVDDLHERAGSSNIIHLHGQLTKARSEINPKILVDIQYNDIAIGDMAEDGYQLRPAIVWFGEMVPLIEKAVNIVKNADYLIVIGTSLEVYPAANLVYHASKKTQKYIIDPKNPELKSYDNWVHIKKFATEGVIELFEIL
jgi:NAD-dependent deacetylase